MHLLGMIGGSQYHRFVNCLQKVMTLPERGEAQDAQEAPQAPYDYRAIRKAVCQELQKLGMNKEDLGTHSIRKVTY